MYRPNPTNSFDLRLIEDKRGEVHLQKLARLTSNTGKPNCKCRQGLINTKCWWGNKLMLARLLALNADKGLGLDAGNTNFERAGKAILSIDL